MVDIDELTNPRPSDETKPAETGTQVEPDISPSKPLEADAGQTASTSDVSSEAEGPISFKSARELHREKMEEQAAQEDEPQQQQEERS